MVSIMVESEGGDECLRGNARQARCRQRVQRVCVAVRQRYDSAQALLPQKCHQAAAVRQAFCGGAARMLAVRASEEAMSLNVRRVVVAQKQVTPFRRY